MKKKLSFVCACLLLATTMGAQGKWESLFNGKNLKGWSKVGGKAKIEVVDGAIVGTSIANTPNTFLRTDKMYTDFILEMEFMIDPMVNSGIQFRSNTDKKYKNGAVFGYQYEMDNAWGYGFGCIYDEARRGWLYPEIKGTRSASAFKAGEWNKVRIEAVGKNLCTWINDIPSANIIDDQSPNGFIALQVHSINKDIKEGSTVKWRNIRIMTEGLEQNRMANAQTIRQINCISNTISEKEAAEGWKLLWDGKTTQGWRSARAETFPTKGWVVEDGVLKVVKSDGGESTNGGDIITTKRYKNFELSVDFKLTEGANSGIKYFVDPDLNKGPGSSIGCEFQLLDDVKHPDAKLGVNGNRTLASLYDLIPALSIKPFLGIGEWNNARVVVKGSKVEHYLNGIKVVDYERQSQMWRALVAYSKYKDWVDFGDYEQGFILLQDHGDEVWFRNIKIKEL